MKTCSQRIIHVHEERYTIGLQSIKARGWGGGGTVFHHFTQQAITPRAFHYQQCIPEHQDQSNKSKRWERHSFPLHPTR